MEHQPISILVAVAAERAAIRRHLRDRPEVPIHLIGLRGACLRGDMIPPRGCVILAGLGGGCHPGLSCGDVIVDPWPDGFVSHNARAGQIGCSDRLLSTPADKAAFYARSGADAVDMESTAVRAAAQAAGARLIHVRAILDTVDDPLPGEMLAWLTPGGRTRPVAVAASLLRRPRGAVDLLRVARRSRHALANLGGVLCDLVGSFRS